MDNTLKISGLGIKLQSVARQNVKGLWVDAAARFDLWRGKLRDEEILLLELKEGAEEYTPTQCAALSHRIWEGNGWTAVFYFKALEFNKRNRMMAQGVFFIVGTKYAFLPCLIMAGRADSRHKTVSLSAPAQYMLMYHLQKRNLNGMSARDMAHFLPYKYVTITLSVQVLTDLGLCTVSVADDQTKRLEFVADGSELYNMALPLLQNPVRKTFFCDSVKGELAVAGINALSGYSMLTQDEVQTYASYYKDISNSAINTLFGEVNSWEGPFKIELWKYPPIVTDGMVDKLSLALTLKDDSDPRVQKELKQMIEGIW